MMNRNFTFGRMWTMNSRHERNGNQISAALGIICAQGSKRTYSKGEIIYQPGDLDSAIYYIRSGKIKLAYLDESGRKLTLSILGENELFGEMALIGERKRTLLAQALEEVSIYEIDERRFLDLVERKPELALDIIGLFGRRTREIERKLEDLVFKDISTRLSRQLLKLVKEHGQETKNGTQIDFKITHKELADLIGSARENTTSALNRLAKEGILDKRRYRIIIKDEEKLKQLGGNL
ncbi:MAG TPA: Crp/Fnr family transcriptional regulator [Candidatus Fraserbacteria bacterium]|nr:Crp/Fnr family transcriptional regulator [Candidatus Fraserbacteria bacterium]